MFFLPSLKKKPCKQELILDMINSCLANEEISQQLLTISQSKNMYLIQILLQIYDLNCSVHQTDSSDAI